MPAAVLTIEVSDAPEVLAEVAAVDARLARQFGATRREAFEMGRAHGIGRMARALLGEHASAEAVESLAQAVARGDHGTTLALLAARRAT
jgi:hypothetical protein